MSAIASAVQATTVEASTLSRVERFHAGYVHVLDDAKFDAWPTFFAEDGFYQITTRENMAAGYPVGILTCDGRGMMQDRVDALQNANIFEQHTYCHIVGRAQLWSESPTLLGARSNFSVFRTMEDGATALFAIGKYLDRIEIDAAGIRFKERRVVLDSRRIDVLLVMPL